MWSLTSWLKEKDAAVLDMQEPLLESDGNCSYSPPFVPASHQDRRISRAASEELPVSTTSSSQLMSFSRERMPDRPPPDRDAVISTQGMHGTTKGFQQVDSPHAIECAGSAPARHSMLAQAGSIPLARGVSDSEYEGHHPCTPAASLPKGVSHHSLHDVHWPGCRQPQHAPDPPGALCRNCRAGSLGRSGSLGRADSMGRRPSRELVGSQHVSRHSQDSLLRHPSRAASLTKEQLINLPPSPFSILHDAQHDILRSGSSHDEQEHVYAEALRRTSSTPQETCSPAHSRRSSMLSRSDSHQGSGHAVENMHSLAARSVSWVPVMHADAQLGAMASMLPGQSAQSARDALRLWHGALKWVALWLLLSGLTLLHTAGLVQAMSNVSVAKVCAGLFCWTGVLGLAGSCKGLLSECLSRHRSDTVAAANALGLKSVSVMAFMTAVLSGLACLVHAFVLDLLSQHDPHLPPCDPNVPLCAETYNLILVLMVATMIMYGAHSAVSAVVAHRAHHARQLLRSSSVSLM